MLKYFSLILSISFILFASCSQKKESTLVAELPAENAPSTLYLMQINDGGQWAKVDSAVKTNEGIYAFNYVPSEPDYFLLSTGGVNGFTLIAEPESKQNVVFTNFPKSFSENESQLNNPTAALYGWIKASKEINNKAELLKEKFSQQQLTQKMLIDSLNALQQDFDQDAKNFIAANEGSVVGLSALQGINPVENIEFYEDVAQQISENSPNSGYLKNLKSTIKKAKEQKVLKAAQEEKSKRLEEKLSIGKPAPEIALNTPSGKQAKLSDLKGNVVLLDFWASWCKPCRAENPNVVRLYNKYQNKGFEVFSVSLDRNKNAWINAIEADNLNWTHVSDLKFWNSAAAQLYGVNSIPATFLLDKDGKIIAKNLRGSSLEQKLAEIFG